MQDLAIRPRRNRKSKSIRRMLTENRLQSANFVLPLFLCEGKEQKGSIPTMPGCARLSTDLLVQEAAEAYELGIPAVALFPAIAEAKKDKYASESKNKDGLLQRCISELKHKIPDLCVISDVAMDPYSSDGHDGVVENGKILNDPTLEILAEMACAQAAAGADIVAPSDMMDGRVGFIRKELDRHSFQETSILSYAAKYASAFYGPFRDALDSAPKAGDKKSYQMDPANSEEALREVALDIEEGADIVMVKPALSYLDIIYRVKQNFSVPVAAYNVSGEFSMIKAAAAANYLDEIAAQAEVLLSIKRAGADIIFSYHAKEIAKTLRQ